MFTDCIENLEEVLENVECCGCGHIGVTQIDEERCVCMVCGRVVSIYEILEVEEIKEAIDYVDSELTANVPYEDKDELMDKYL